LRGLFVMKLKTIFNTKMILPLFRGEQQTS